MPYRNKWMDNGAVDREFNSEQIECLFIDPGFATKIFPIFFLRIKMYVNGVCICKEVINADGIDLFQFPFAHLKRQFWQSFFFSDKIHQRQYMCGVFTQEKSMITCFGQPDPAVLQRKLMQCMTACSCIVITFQ